MHLDKTKLTQLISKADSLSVVAQNGFQSTSTPLITKQLGTLLSSLSDWAAKHPNLSNGAAYGKKLAELKSKLPDSNRHGSWFPDKEAK